MFFPGTLSARKPFYKLDSRLSLRYNAPVPWGKTSRSEERDRFCREAMAYLDHLYRVALYLAKEPEDARDLVQETYARALKGYGRFAWGTNMKAWLTRILYNFFFDDYQRRKRWVSLEGKTGERESERDYPATAPPAENPGPEDDLLKKELSAGIAEALTKIPEEFRLPVILVDMGDFSYAETAEILACPVGTIRSRLSRGRRLLQRHLKGYL